MVRVKSIFIEDSLNNQKVYDSLLVEPGDLSLFNSELALKIVSELSKNPLCAMDLARKIGEHEQKIYYHLRKMKNAGVIKLERSEARCGMTAKIYSLVSPVVSTKLDGSNFKTNGRNVIMNEELEKILEPFIVNGKLNAKIIVGAPQPHGNYGATARDGVYVIDFTLFIGKFIQNFIANLYKIDIEINGREDLNDNLVLIGSPKINTIVDKINDKLPIYFDASKEWAIKSKLTGNTYDYDDDALILKLKNPFNKKKEILLLAGRRSRGLRSAILAFTQHSEEIAKGNIENPSIIAKVVRGIDKDGDGIVDSVTFLE